jgi:hypothetical protein
MVTLPIAAIISRDATRGQFEERPQPHRRPPIEDPEPRVTLRGRGARVLRSLANRLEPEPECA